MKTTFIISFTFILCCLTELSYSQVQRIVHFSYDLAGNRETRWLSVIELKSTDSIKNLEIPIVPADLSLKTKIYPNPTKGQIMIDIEDGTEECSEVFFYDQSGRFIEVKNLLTKSGILNVSNYKMGIYYLVIKNNNNKSLYKIIKQ